MLAQASNFFGRTVHSGQHLPLLIPLYVLCLLLVVPESVTGSRYVQVFKQRIFEDMNAISFADPLKNGFRIILAEEFIKKHLRPSSLPTLFATAVPLGSQGTRQSAILYPDAVKEDKMVKISGLKERSWYYVCIEWENINHHNETTGISCKIYRTLDRFGKSAATAVTDIEVKETTGHSLRFRVKFDVNYKARLSAYLTLGPSVVPAQTFLLDRSGTLDVRFPYLEPQTVYGQLCVMEEPLVTAYSSMGRLIGGIVREKCYFDGLKTKSENSLTMATQPAKAYRRIMDSSSASSASLVVTLTSCLMHLFPVLAVVLLRNIHC